jgi:hypothetical protein
MRPIVPLAADIEPPSVLIAGWMAESSAPRPFVLFPEVLVSDDKAAVTLPVTMHNRLWKWPALVGPINIAGGSPSMVATPSEIPTIDSGLSLPAITAWPRGDDASPPLPFSDVMPTQKIPCPEQEAMGLRNVWTRAHPTLPMWAPEIVGGWVGGSNARFVISGVTRGSTGSPLGGCNVIAMSTEEMAVARDPDAVIVDIEVSDANGAFALQVPRNVAHMLVGYKAGSPDVAGVTVNTLQPVEV